MVTRATTYVHVKTSEELRAYAKIAESMGKTLKPGKNVLGSLVVYIDRKTDPTEEPEEDEDE